MVSTARWRLPRRWSGSAVRVSASVLGAVIVVAGCGASAPTPPRTAAVTRASVSTSVSAVGSVATGQVNVGFAKGGQLTSVAVGVGDTVTPGEVLATVDDFGAKQALRQAEAQRDAQQANLDRAEDSTAVDGARASLDQARRVLAATERVAASGAAGGAGAGGGTAQAAGAMASGSTSSDAGQLQVETARSQVVAAENALDAAETDRPHLIDAAEAAVDGAQAGVNNARQDLANTTLRAPTAGTVSALNGAPGEFLAPSSGTTAQAPGGAAIPGAPAAAAAGAGGAAGAAATPTRPGGAQFIVLDLNSFQIVAPFQEADSSAITVGQRVDVAVDALPDTTLTGSVSAVSPAGAAIANVVNYYVTVALPPSDPRLREGQTARASVVTGEVDNTLSVPNTAVRRQGDSTSVVVLEPDGRQVTTRFTAGIVGTDRTQVVGGLDENQQVLLTGGQG